jgi:ABC-2 type transport system permease protein
MPIAWKAWAFFKRDLFTDLSYKLAFTFQLLDVVVGVCTYYFLARMIGRAAYHGYEPFAFILVGVAVNGYMSTSLACYAYSIRGIQPLGTLKMVLATPTSPMTFILLSSVYPLLRAAFDAFIYLLSGALLGLALARVNVPAVLLIFLLSELAFSSIGILSATFTLVFKRGDPLLWLFAGLSWLLGGVYFPIDILPRWLRDAAQLLPITHALLGMRAAMLQHATFRMLLPQIGILGVFALVGLPLSLLAFQWGVRWAKVTGTLSHF